MTDKDIAQILAQKIGEAGGTAYFAGGFVRDSLMGTDNKDIDIEVHGVEPGRLKEIISTVGECTQYGESFGVFGIKGRNIDIALPRTESVTGCGHRDFDISVNPFLGTYKACIRRDFTINAMLQNILTGEIIDYFGGRGDMKNGVLRRVNEKSFPEDPLRVLRAAQFAARFEFEIEPGTMALCRSIDISSVSKERVEAELKKALLKADKPSIFFKTLRSMDKLDVFFDELKALIGVPQNIKYHKEGDVWTHTMMVTDEAAKLRDKVFEPYYFMLSAVCHDLGKAAATEIKDGVAHSFGHEKYSAVISETFLKRFSNEKALIKYVKNMAFYHMKPNVLAAAKSAVKSTNKMFDSAVSPHDLIYLAKADGLGKLPQSCDETSTKFLFERLEVYREYMARPFVQGRDLIEAGQKPGKDFSEVLSYAHKLRLAGVEKQAALKQTLSYAKSLEKSKTDK